jgi:uncharacterized membrane protein
MKVTGDMLRNKWFQLILALVAWCLTLLLIRVERSGSTYYTFLAWNLFLAAVPLFASSAFARMEKRDASALAQVGCFSLWLLFFPNAPYILTDLMHLAPRPPVPMWYDLALILSCGGTGLLFGYLSMVEVHAIVGRRFGVIIGWLTAISSLLLAGFGIYLGRFLRLNSWDIVRKPESILTEIVQLLRHPGHNSPTVGVTIIFGAILALWYIAMRLLTVQPAASYSTKPSDQRTA